ncbi:glycosyltransferase family 39 protein [bacterium]|nr:glycosyltransferase family 39 protein [bacterium]
MDNQARQQTSRNQWIFWVVAAGFILWAVAWACVFEPEHDEIEHFHAAWLMHQGEQPFDDFFEHHEPAFWNLLQLYYLIFGENYGIILTARLLTLAIFLLTSFYTFRVARFFTGPEGAWIAAFSFPLFNMSYMMANLFVRGDPLILLLLMICLYSIIGLTQKPVWSVREDRSLLFIFLLMGLAVAISPRAGIPVLTLFIAAGSFSLKRWKLGKSLGLFLVGGLIVCLPILIEALIYDVDHYIFWVFKFSTSIYPPFSPIRYISKLLITAAPIWLLAVYAVWRFFKFRNQPDAAGKWIILAMAVTNFAGLWASSRPFMQQFLTVIPFWGLLAGLGYDDLFKRLRHHLKLARFNWAGLLLLAGLIVLAGRSIPFWSNPAMTHRSAWIERAQWMVDNTSEDATFAAGMAFFHPIFMQDAVYYWFAGRYAYPTLDRLGRAPDPYTFQALRVTRPTIIHETFGEVWGFKFDPEFRQWLEKKYEPTPYKEYWIRKQ